MTRLYVSMGFFPDDYFRNTVGYIEDVQQADGAIPWYDDGYVDPWDHVEAAMGLTIGGRFEAARQAYRWLGTHQRPNGSWLAAYKDGKIHDGTRAESNFVAYVATGIWHYYLSTRDTEFVREMWPVVRDAIDFVLTLQGPDGEIYWALDSELGIRRDSLITGCSSIYKSLECAILIARTLDAMRPDWELARTRLGYALRYHPECFDRTWDSKSRFAMDWFYPVLTGVIGGNTAVSHLRERWDQFVVHEQGCRCVDDEPWVTVAESCELVMALLMAGEYQRAVQLFSWMHEMRHDDGAYWTGYVFPDDAIWPEEKPTWTAGAVLLAADALSNATPAAHLFRQSLPSESAEQAERLHLRQRLEKP